MTFYTNVRSYGNDILFVGYNKKGERVQKRIPFKPEFYLANPAGQNPDAVSYDGTNLKKFETEGIQDSKDFLSRYQGVSAMTVYGHSKPAVQFVSKMFKGDIAYKLDLIRIFYLDIEVMADGEFPTPEKAEKKITVISVYDSKTEKTYSWGIKPYDNKDPNVIWHQFTENTEEEMLYSFLSWWSMNYPDIVTGWHSRGFDIPYLINRIRNICGNPAANKLSPWGRIQQKTVKTQKFATSSEETNYDIYGVADLDYLDLYKKYMLSASESYKLDFVAEQELGERKLGFDGTLHELFTKDYDTYVKYNIQDVNLVKRLEEKKRYLALIIEVAYVGHVPQYTDALGTVSYWEYLIYSYLYAKNIIPPIKNRIVSGDRDFQYAGAYVKEPISGMHRWVVSFDLTSLYPSVIRQLNIGPETFVGINPKFKDRAITVEKLLAKAVNTDDLKGPNYTMAANGAMYSKKQKSFISELVGHIFNLRKLYKKQMIALLRQYEETKDEAVKSQADILDIKQHACKILINACYGAIGNQYFQYYSIDNAEAVTLTGQLTIRWTQERVNQYLNNLLKTTDVDYILASDTDSVYINLGPLVSKMFPGQEASVEHKTKIANFVDRFCEEKISPFIEQIYDELFNYTNGYENHMSMKREIISDAAIWTTKKRYAANVIDSEGVRFKEPELKVKGLEIVKSSTPEVCRNAMKDCVKIVLTGNEKQFTDYIAKFKKEFMQMTPKEVAFPRGVTDVDKYKHAQKGVPMHVRAALNYNKMIDKHKLNDKYEKVKNGAKIRFVPLIEPNPVWDDVIGFTDNLPPEFKVQEYVDYQAQFEKAFLAPIQTIAELVNWKTDANDNFDDLFS